MIEFVTLFLGGLIAGTQAVEVMVDETVAAIELRLDDVSLARLESEPWVIGVDFGSELAPHLLEAVAFGVDGKEIDRVRQWINMAPHEADASILLDRDGPEGKTLVRVSWETLADEGDPSEFRAFFDGQRLQVADPEVFPLPGHDPEQTHHLRVELEFGDSLMSVAEATFGGIYGEVVSTELTSFPIVLDRRKKLPPIEDLQGRFLAGDEPLAVHGAEHTRAEIVFVRDAASQDDIKRLVWQQNLAVRLLSLEKDHVVRFVSPCPRPLERKGRLHWIFPRSHQFDHEDGFLPNMLAAIWDDTCSDSEARLSDAVAVAALGASQSGLRRVVVLLTSTWEDENSLFEASQVMRYLARLHVPFEVWSAERVAGKYRDRDWTSPWGEVVSVSSADRLSEAYFDLAKRLSRQRVVWLEGLHLPQSISIHPAAENMKTVSE